MKASSSSSAEVQDQHREERHRFYHFFEKLIKPCINCLGLDDYSTVQYDHIVLMSDPPPPPVIEREMKCREDEGTSSSTARELRTRVKKPSVSSGHGVQIN